MKLVEMDGVNLTFDEAALDAIADKALERKTGARGLRAIMEELMQQVMYEIPSRDDIEAVRITEAAVNGLEKPQYVPKKQMLADNSRPELPA